MNSVGGGERRFVVATFYKVVPVENYYDMKPVLLDFCKSVNMKGTILLSHEGINSTVCGPSSEAIEAFFAFLSADERFVGIKYYLSYAAFCPFDKMVVRLKREIVNMGGYPVDMSDTGSKVDADEWDEVIARDDVITIDVRNVYEYDIGTFKGANVVVSATDSFSQFVPWFEEWVKTHDKNKFAICCTGGIRCEKAGAYIKSRGYEVYNLNKGIIKYIADRKGTGRSTWLGTCFVFDNRVAVNSNLDPEPVCLRCGCQPPIEDLRAVTRGRVVCAKCMASVGSACDVGCGSACASAVGADVGARA